MSGRQDIYALCPYYRRAERQKIVCEGVEMGTTLHVAFATTTLLQDYKTRFCDKDYNQCCIAGMLNRKWDDEQIP